MPVSGKEETGIKPLARQFSEYSAGVPIKKRKIPFFWPPSPPHEQQSSKSSENGLLDKQSDHSQEPAGTDANLSGSSTGLSSKNENILCKDGQTSTSANVNMQFCKDGQASTSSNVNVQPIISDSAKVKLEEPTLTTNTSSLSGMKNEQKLVNAESSFGIQLTMGKSDMVSRNIESDALSLGKDTYRKVKGEEKCQPKISSPSGNTELSLSFASNLEAEKKEADSLIQENIDTVSAEVKCSSTGGSNTDGGHLPSNRANWDLNTTIDAWEGSVNDVNPDQKIHDCHAQVTEASICNTDIVDSGLALANKAAGENKQSVNFQMSGLSRQLQPSDSTLCLGISPVLQSYFQQGCTGSSSKADSARVNSDVSLPRSIVQPGSGEARNHSVVKREPVEECTRQGFKLTEVSAIGLLSSRGIKHELVGKSCLEAESSRYSNAKLAAPTRVKSEPVNEGNNANLKTIEPSPVESNKQIQGPGIVTAHDSCMSGAPTSKTGASAIGDTSNSSKDSTSCTREDQQKLLDVPQELCNTALHVSPEAVTLSSVINGDGESNSHVTKDAAEANEKCIPDTVQHRLESATEASFDLGVNCEDSGSDEEKVNISGDILEEDSYGSDYESDGNHTAVTATDREKDVGEEDYFEDGEVRESEHCCTTDNPLCEQKREVENVHCNSDDKGKDCAANTGNDFLTSSVTDGSETKIKDSVTSDKIQQGTKGDNEEKSGEVNDRNMCLPESQAVEMVKECDNVNCEAAAKQTSDLSGGGDPYARERAKSSGEVGNGSEGVENRVQNCDETVNSDVMKKNELEFPKREPAVNSDDISKDGTTGGNPGRIIRLSTSSSVSPGRTRCSTGRERLPDISMEGYQLHQRGRGEGYMTRERHLDETSRSSRLNFMHRRGRMSSRINSVHNDWDSERGLAPEYYNVQTDFGVSRHKYGPDVANAEVDFNFEMVSDGSFTRGWGGRNVISDDTSNLRHLPSRRRSPNRRDGPNGHSFHMVSRVPRNNSPSRCIGEDGSELVAMRHNQKFMRGCHDDNVDPVMARGQPQFEGVEDQFARGGRHFSSFRRRGPPQIRSKSPIRSRSRSPRPWSSPRRRSPDGFGGRSELPRRRSPMYRMERIRSFDHPCFPREIVNRRHGSPPYMPRSSDMRQDHGHPRSIIRNRSPPTRMLLRNGRRFDIVDSRERTDGEDYFGGPVHAGRFQEINGEGGGDDRRLGERHGPVRSFRPPYRRRYHD